MPQSRAQNVVDPGMVGSVWPSTSITAEQVSKLISFSPPAPRGLPASAKPVVAEIASMPRWRPLHLTLGISGFESYFTHPDELFFVLSLGPSSPEVRALLLSELETFPPYGLTGYRLDEGRPRELYDVPVELHPKKVERVDDCFGIYSFWLFCRTFQFGDAAKERTAMQEHWGEIKTRLQPLLTCEYPFDPARSDYARDEAEHLNGDIAGLIGAVRLGKICGDASIEPAILGRLRQILEKRINLERVNPRVWTPTHFASKTLHTGKLARYLKLTPELGFALREWTDGAAAARLQTLRKKFPTWWIARGDRLIGGENYISPLHFSRALWQGLAWVENDPKRWDGVALDIPWCRADLAFVEKAFVFGMRARQ
ncbi:MAG: hypothetical protein ACR2OZ_09785 [Verrucomicrobiales bacterium]